MLLINQAGSYPQIIKIKCIRLEQGFLFPYLGPMHGFQGSAKPQVVHTFYVTFYVTLMSVF